MKVSLMIRVWVRSAMIMAGVVPAVAFATDTGSFLTQYADREYILSSSADVVEPSVAEPLIENYIRTNFPNREKAPNVISTADLALRIAGAAYCFQLDPFVFTGLIHKESITFDQRAKSPTGAEGLTQFTTVATQEVSDQLGMRGPGDARALTTQYFSNVISGNCLSTAGGFTSMGSQYQALWDMKPASKYQKGSAVQARVMTQMFPSYPEYAILYGAILLKENLSLVENGLRNGCIKYKKGETLTLVEKFREVLMNYNGDDTKINGDPCTLRLGYEKDIIDSFYPAIRGKKAL